MFAPVGLQMHSLFYYKCPSSAALTDDRHRARRQQSAPRPKRHPLRIMSEVTTDEQTRESVHLQATIDALLQTRACLEQQLAVARIDRLVQDMATLSLSVDKPRHQGVIQCSSSSSKKRRGRSTSDENEGSPSPPAAATAMPRVRLPTPSCQRPFLSLLSKSASRDAEAKAVAWARGTALELHGGLWCPSSAAALPGCLLAARRSS